MIDSIKLTIAIPTAGSVRMAFANSLCSLVSKIAAEGIKTRKDSEIIVKMDVQESSVIHTNREMLVHRAIEADQTHLLFLDDDMVFDPRVIDILFGRRQPVVACNYLIKSAHPDFVAVGLNGHRIKTLPDSEGLHPIAYSGFGVSLFEMEVWKKTPQPWFLPKFVPAENCYTTEDNPCYERIREAGFPVYVDHDASKLVAHAGTKVWDLSDYKPSAKVVELAKVA